MLTRKKKKSFLQCDFARANKAGVGCSWPLQQLQKIRHNGATFVTEYLFKNP
jgi:hypothetical protein